MHESGLHTLSGSFELLGSPRTNKKSLATPFWIRMLSFLFFFSYENLLPTTTPVSNTADQNMDSNGFPNGTVVYGANTSDPIQFGMPRYNKERLIYCDPPEGVTRDFNSPYPLGTLYIVIATSLLIISPIFVAVRIYTKILLTRSPGWDDCKTFSRLHALAIQSIAKTNISSLDICVLSWVRFIFWSRRTKRSGNVFDTIFKFDWRALGLVLSFGLVRRSKVGIFRVYTSCRGFIVARMRADVDCCHYLVVTLGMGRHSWDDNSTIAHQEEYLHLAFIASIVYFAIVCFVKVSILLLYLRTFTESRRFRYIVYVVLF